MATQTPHSHPQKAAQMAGFYPHTATFKTTKASGVQLAEFSSPCSYDPAHLGGESGDFESETPAHDRILLPLWHPQVVAEMLVVLTFRDGTVKKFPVEDSLPIGTGPDKTLVLVTPKR